MYSVYMLAVSGCSKVVNTFSSSLEPAFGNMIARGEKDTLRKRVSLCTTMTIQVAIVLFCTAAIVLSPFISIYTKGVTDVQYLRPAFGIVMLVAEAFYCIRLPYQSAVYAAGHFRQTRNGAIAEAALNIVISVILVSQYGLIGVAIGTLVSMFFRTCQYIWYYHAKLIGNKHGFIEELRRVGISLLEIAVIYSVARLLPEVSMNGYFQWFLYSVGVGIICALVAAIFSGIFYRSNCKELLRVIKRLLHK